VGSELGVVELSGGVRHVLVAHEFHDASAILVHVRVTHVTGLSHVILQILPAPRWRKSGDQASVIGAARIADSVAAAAAHAAPSAAAGAAAEAASTTIASASTGAGTTAARELHAEFVTIIIVSFSGVDCVIRVARIFELDESEGRPTLILQIDEGDFAVFVEQILDVLGANIGREIAHVDAAVAASARHGRR